MRKTIMKNLNWINKRPKRTASQPNTVSGPADYSNSPIRKPSPHTSVTTTCLKLELSNTTLYTVQVHDGIVNYYVFTSVIHRQTKCILPTSI